MRIDIHHHHHDDDFRRDVIDALTHLGIDLNRALEKIMKTLDEVLAAVTDEDTKVDSIIVLLNGIKQQLTDALAGTTLPPAVQAKVDAIFDKATQSAGKIDAAIAANTPTP